MSSFNDLLADERDYLETRFNEFESEKENTPGWWSVIGAPFGVTRFGNPIESSINRGYNNYIAAPLASGIRYVMGDRVRKKHLRDDVSRIPLSTNFDVGGKYHHDIDWNSPAITSRGEFKTLEMPSRNQRRSKTQRGQRRRPLFGVRNGATGSPNIQPGTHRNNASGRPMIFGRDGKWHDWEQRNSGITAYYDLDLGQYVVSSRPNQRGWNPPPRGGRNKPTRRPRRVRFPIGVPPPLPNTFNNETGLKIGGADSAGDNFSMTKSIADDSKVNIKIYLGNIGYTTAGKVTWTPNAADIGGQYYFNPSMGAYQNISSMLSTMGARYRRYRLLSGGKMEFKPLISAYSNPDIRVAALLTKDIDEWGGCTSTAFVGSPATPTSVDTPTRVTVMSNPKACATTGWAEKGFSCPIPPTKWLHCQGPDSTQSSSNIVDFTNSWARYEQCLAFTLGINISGTVGASTINVLEAWIDVRVEFKGQAPTAGVALSLRDSNEKKIDQILALLKKTGFDIDDKDRVEEPPSPTPSKDWSSVESKQLTGARPLPIPPEQARLDTMYSSVFGSKKSSSLK
jgi:hypothetical protein